MRAGRLDKRVTLQRQATTQSATGAEIDTWTDLGERWAGISPLMGKEFYANSGEHAQITTRIRMRSDSLTSTLYPNDRINHGTNYYDIESIQDPNEEGAELVLMCKLWQSR